MKAIFAAVFMVGLLTACAGRSGYDAPSSRSGVEVYGTIDAGIGSQKMSR
ncbi:hypothetical protein [Candidimonas sp. SYP-B2681]|nr:hypothetical protein [Candidimonas sp. SYP-B2681]